MSNCNCPPVRYQTAASLELGTVCGGSQLFMFMTLLETFLSTQCDLADPCRQLRFETGAPPGRANGNNDDDDDQLTFDFIVIGSGAAGAAVAARLSENASYRVLLLEAGGGEPIALQVPAFYRIYLNSAVDWRYKTQPNNRSFLSNRPQFWPRGKMLGGSTGMNGMLYLRGTRQNFDAWQVAGNEGWGYDQVLPFYMRAEDYYSAPGARVDAGSALVHGRGGPVAVSEPVYRSQTLHDLMRAAKENGFAETDLNAANSTGVMYSLSTTRHGVRVSTARGYLHPAWERRNLHIRLHTQATRVLIDPKTRRALGVETVDVRDGRRLRWLIRREVVVAAGIVESPKLLMLSGIGEPQHLREHRIRPVVERRGVGENLQSHTTVKVLSVARLKNQTTTSWATAHEYIRHRGGPLSSLGALLHMRYSSRLATEAGGVDAQISLLDNANTPEVICSKTGKERGNEPRVQLTARSVCLQPKSRGRIRLASADPLRPPIIESNALDADEDVEVILEGVKRILEIYRADALRAYGLELKLSLGACSKFALLSDDYWRCVIRHETEDYGHLAGSCKMGPSDDPDAVVDSELRVHGTVGLRVIDASIMPTIVAANPMATTTMIGEKGAQMMLDYWSAADRGDGITNI